MMSAAQKPSPTYLRLAKSWIKQTAMSIATGIAGDEERHVLIRTVSGPARGLKFRLDLMSGYQTAYLWGNYEKEVVSKLSALVRGGDTVWDCGCYIGYYTCLFARLVGPQGAVVAIEPDYRNMRRLKQNVMLNGISNVTFVECALGTGENLPFVLSDDTNSHIQGAWVGGDESQYSPKQSLHEARAVPSISLDQLYMRDDIPNPDIVKIDIEGFESVALAHAEAIARKLRPKFVLELHNPICDKAAWEFGLRYDYSIWSMKSGSEVLRAEDVSGTVLLIPRA